jgi:hypothetical protein
VCGTVGERYHRPCPRHPAREAWLPIAWLYCTAAELHEERRERLDGAGRGFAGKERAQDRIARDVGVQRLGEPVATRCASYAFVQIRRGNVNTLASNRKS